MNNAYSVVDDKKIKAKNIDRLNTVLSCVLHYSKSRKRSIIQDEFIIALTTEPIYVYRIKQGKDRTMLYGECLHKYTIKEAIHDEAVL